MKLLQQSGRDRGPRWFNYPDRGSRQDLTHLRHEMYSGMEGLRYEMDGLRYELRSEMDDFRVEVKNEINQLRTEMKADIKGVGDGLTSLREVVAGLSGKVDGLSRSVNLLTKLVMLLMAAAIAAGGWNAIRSSGERGNKQPMLAMAEAAEDGEAE